jgi:hypothetical protein
MGVMPDDDQAGSREQCVRAHGAQARRQLVATGWNGWSMTEVPNGAFTGVAAGPDYRRAEGHVAACGHRPGPAYGEGDLVGRRDGHLRRHRRRRRRRIGDAHLLARLGQRVQDRHGADGYAGTFQAASVNIV